MAEVPAAADEDGTVYVSGVAARLKAAREKAGLSLKEVAETTRVPLRHLASIEEGNFSALPGTTYVAGFARAYARAVGLDEDQAVSDLRTEIGEMGGLGQSPYEFEEAVNPARIPPRWLAWVAALIVLGMAAGYGIWRMQLTTAPTEDQITAEVNEANAQVGSPPPAAAPKPVTGPVVMTAADDVWMRIYQADGTRLYEGLLKRGESYTIPDNARDPLILTGRPDALAITVGGQAIPPLGTAEKSIADVPVSAAALLARSPGSASPVDNAAAPIGNASAATAPPPVAPVPGPRKKPRALDSAATSGATPAENAAAQ